MACRCATQGDEDKKGIIPRAVEHLFDEVQRCGDTEEVTISVSFVEIYLERIRDLLDKSKSKAGGPGLHCFALQMPFPTILPYWG